jgi:hypothetical protein
VNFTDWRAYVDALGVLNIALWGGWIGWRRRPEFLRRASLVVPVFFVPYLLFGTVREARYYLPVLAILIPLALLYLQETMERSAWTERASETWRAAAPGVADPSLRSG